MFNIPGDESCKLNFLAPSITSFKQNYALCVVLQAIIDPKGRVYQINSRAGSHLFRGGKEAGTRILSLVNSFLPNFNWNKNVPQGQRSNCALLSCLRLHRFKKGATFSGNTADISGGAFAVLFGERIRR